MFGHQKPDRPGAGIPAPASALVPEHPTADNNARVGVERVKATGEGAAGQRRRRPRWSASLAAVVAVGAVLAGGDASWVWAESAGAGEPGGGAEQSTEAVREVVDRLRLVIIAIASALGTLFLTIGGLRWMIAGGDPGQVDSAKRSLTGAAIGYGIAILATVLMTILDFVVSGGGGQ